MKLYPLASSAPPVIVAAARARMAVVETATIFFMAGLLERWLGNNTELATARYQSSTNDPSRKALHQLPSTSGRARGTTMTPRDTPRCSSNRSTQSRTLRAKQRRSQRNSVRLSIKAIDQVKRDMGHEPE